MPHFTYAVIQVDRRDYENDNWGCTASDIIAEVSTPEEAERVAAASRLGGGRRKGTIVVVESIPHRG